MIVRLFFLGIIALLGTPIQAQSFKFMATVLNQNNRVVKGSPEHVCTYKGEESHGRGMIGFRRKKNDLHSIYFLYSRHNPFVRVCLGDVVDHADIPPDSRPVVSDVRLGKSEGDSNLYGLGYGIETKPWLNRFTMEIVGIINIEHAVDTDFKLPEDWALQSYSGYLTRGVASFHAGVQPVPELLIDLECRLIGGLSGSIVAAIRYGYHKTATASGFYTHLPTGFTEDVEWVLTPSAMQMGVAFTYDFQWRRGR